MPGAGPRGARLEALPPSRRRPRADALPESPRRSLRSRTPAVVPFPSSSRRTRRARSRPRSAPHSGQAADFHRLRIRCKRLRYALEFSHDCYGARRSASRGCSPASRRAGEMQDAEVAARRLRSLALAGTDASPSRPCFAIGGVAERYRRECELLLRRLAREVRVVEGAEWRRLTTFSSVVGRGSRGAARPTEPAALGAVASCHPRSPRAAPGDSGGDAAPRRRLVAPPGDAAGSPPAFLRTSSTQVLSSICR